MQVRKRIEDLADGLTATERRLASAILADYPFAGLEPIQGLAERTRISSPTISRFVTKLGFQGYQDFQQHLIAELKEGQRSPVDLQKTSRPFRDAFLHDFMDRSAQLVSETADAVGEAQFDRVCGLLTDRKRAIYLIGGRMSTSIAHYLSFHLRQFRAKVYHIPADPEVWPEYVLRMKPRDILFIADFRRYQKALLRLAEQADGNANAHILLMTDKWLSPISRHARDVLAVPIDNGTLWDSYAGALALAEAIVTRIAETNWDETRKRIETWDSLRLDFGDPEDDR
ncbi:MurR/RpiR family transcriptional regulator [Pseudodonghicola sp.]|uniref:MurR/RpiR family transcriptional regulator n=1 Tax=Pseudodonghicola sp. TaxID=1969463 RepID=UPI003A977CE6